MKKRAIYTIFIFLVLNVQAQSGFRFKNLSINDGLSQSSVTAIVQDELNALWIGTQDGLNRYDGKTFEIFTSDETQGLESEYITCALKDKKGNLWFGTSNGLTVYDLEKEKFQTFKPTKGSSFYIKDLAEDDEGNLWVASAETGIYKFTLSNLKFQGFAHLLNSQKTKKLQPINTNELVVATEEGWVYICDILNNESFGIDFSKKYGAEITINNITPNGYKKFIVSTNKGAYKLNTDTKKVEPFFMELNKEFGQQSISDVYFESGVGWMVCTNNNGLFLIDESKKVFHSVEDIFQKTALLFNELNLIYKDGSGTFWIGSQRGLSSFNPHRRGFLGVGPSGNPERGIPSSSVWSFAEDKEEKYVYIGTDRAISRYDRKSGKFQQYYRQEKTTFGTGERAILAIEVISPRKLLVGCTDGLFELNINGEEYNYKRIKLEREVGGRHDRVYSIVYWKDHLFWLGTKDGAVLYDENKGVVEFFEHNPELTDQTISKGVCRHVFKDLNGRVWFSTSTGGLNILSQKDDQVIIRPYEHNYAIKAVSTDYITTIYQRKKGEYWFGTSGSGLMRWDERSRTVEVFNKAHQGLPNDVVYGIVSGKGGSLWLSTNKGLCNIYPDSKIVKNYTEVDGLMSNEFNLGASIQLKSGVLFFGGIYGYNYFNPEELVSSKREIDVVFSRFKIENQWLTPQTKGSPLSKPIFETREINLSYKQRSFTIRFQPSDLSNPDRINYKYVLEGSEEGEVFIGSSNEIHFSALSHGTYILKVYGRYGGGNWGSPAVLKITIATPFWLAWWFWMIIVLVLVVIIRVFVRMRIEAARRDQVRLEMKIRDRTREIKQQNVKIESQKKKIEEERNKVVEQQKLLQIEKDKTERLLKNVIPASTAEELKKTGKARARAYKTVSVLFTDFVGFTHISDRMTATELVKRLDVYFTKFDEIIVSNNLEKIKTIGDAYMCAGGVPVRNNTNPIDACLAALQIQDYMIKRRNDAIANGDEFWQLRLGINTGEVTAGVIGSERLAYDIWGATVNQAQRMEMLGEPEKVTITGATFKHIEPYFECAFLGKAQTKSRGLIDMYCVLRIKPELSENEEGIYPNSRFHQIVNLHHYSSINYYKAERHIMKVLEQRLSDKLYYHSIAHTKDVVSAVERLALLEDVTDEGLFLLKSAATYHDAGFVEAYDKNEPIGAKLADEILPKYGYTQKHIEQIKELIFVTQIPHKPKNKLEEIICDADLDYLGRDDFHEISDKLRRELKEHGKISSDRQWDEIQVAFLNQHRYFTKTSIKTRTKGKERNLEEVIKRLEENKYEEE